MTTVLYMLGLVASAAMTGIFLSALRGSFTNGYNFAALVSLLILSSFSTVIFLALLGGQVLQALPRRIRTPLWAALSTPSLLGLNQRGMSVTSQRANRHLLPQSEFARRWMKRKSKSYEDGLCESREKGEQLPYRLKARQIDLIKSQTLGTHERYSRLEKSRRG